MVQYSVFSDGILDGTIADHPPAVRWAWVAILFEAEKLRGRIHMPVRVLARRASISIEEAAESLRLFQEPDPLSSSVAYEGRRLLPVDGEENCYILTTWEDHVKRREIFFHRLRQQRHAKKKQTVETKDL